MYKKSKLYENETIKTKLHLESLIYELLEQNKQKKKIIKYQITKDFNKLWNKNIPSLNEVYRSVRFSGGRMIIKYLLHKSTPVTD